MKNKSNISLFSLSAIVLIFTSCGSIEFEKRYHQGGFHLSFGKNKQDKNETVRPPRQKKAVSTEVVSETLPSRTEELNTPHLFTPEQIQHTQNTEPKNEELPSHCKRVQFQSKTASEPLAAATATVTKPGLKKQLKKHVGTDVPESDIKFILYFILCLVLPPLAYYLIKEETDKWFWVCLLCFLFTLTWLTGFQLGLLGVVSVLIAILALLNKI